MKINKQSVPEFIKNSQLYKEISEASDNDQIVIMGRYYVNNIEDNLKTIEDFSKILNICRYWMVNQVPCQIYDFLFEYLQGDHDSELLDEIINDFSDFPFINELKLLIKYFDTHNINYEKPNFKVYEFDQYTFMTKAVEYKYLDLLKWGYKNNFKWNENTCIVAALNSNAEILKYLMENGCDWSKDSYAEKRKDGKCINREFKNKISSAHAFNDDNYTLMKLIKYMYTRCLNWNLIVYIACVLGDDKKGLEWL